MSEAFRGIRHRILSQPRDPEKLRREVIDMRRRMHRELGSKSADLFHLKQDPGGIADIEFLVQYGVLAWSARHPSLTEWTDNVRILESFTARDLISEADAKTLNDAYLALRAREHAQALQGNKGMAPINEITALRQHVLSIWDRLMAGPDTDS